VGRDESNFIGRSPLITLL